jgi:large subunit ribosomal protein L18
MDIAKTRLEARDAKHSALRKKVMGTADRPRLCVRRTLKHMIAQVVDDLSGKSLLQVHSKTLGIKGKKSQVAKELGKAVATQLKGRGIERIVFDRGGYVYHGRIKAVADGARENGLKF